MQRNNIIAGLFLITGLAAFVLMSFVLSDIDLARTSVYRVNFTLTDGVAGVEPGSQVRVGGVKCGKVTDVEFIEGGAGPEGVQVTIRLRADIPLRQDAIAQLERPLIGSLASINFTSAGTLDAAPLGEGDELEGAVPSLFASVGGGDFHIILDRFELFMDKAQAVADDIQPQVRPMIDDIRGILSDARSVSSKFEERTGGWVDDIDVTLDDAKVFVGNLDQTRENVDRSVEDARMIMADARTIISDNRPAFDESISNVRDVTRHVRDESIPRVDKVLDRVEGATGSYQTFGEQLVSALDQEMPGVQRTLANVRLASDQFKLVMTEIRANPWRLLVRPNTKELERQLLYDAARSYAEAVSDLRAVSEAMSALQASGRLAPEEIRAMSTQLDEAFVKYRETEAELLRRFGEDL